MPDKPTVADYAFRIGSIYLFQTRDTRKSLHYFEQARDAGTEELFIAHNLALSYRANGKIHEAIKYHEHQLGKTPDDAVVQYEAGQTYFEAKRYSDAISRYQAAIQLDSEDADYHHALGITYMYLDEPDFNRSYAALKIANRLRPNNGITLQALGISSFERKQYRDVVRYYEQCLQVNANALRDYEHYQLAYSHHRLKDYAAADAALVKIIRSNDENVRRLVSDLRRTIYADSRGRYGKY